METSIYITDGAIHAIQGTDGGAALKMQRHFVKPLPSGTITSGLVTNADALNTALTQLSRELSQKNVRLVIDSDGALIRIVDTPKLSEKKLWPIIKSQLAPHTDGFADPIFDYMPLGADESGQGQRVLCCVMERPRLQAYTNAFKLGGFRLQGIDIDICCAIRYASRVTGMQEQSFILTILGGDFVSLLLFVDGAYSYLERVRLREARGTSALAVELSRAISRILQFHQAQRRGSAITMTYVSGLVGDELSFIPEISQSLGIDVSPPPVIARVKGEDETELRDSVYLLGNMLSDSKSSQLIQTPELPAASIRSALPVSDEAPALDTPSEDTAVLAATAKKPTILSTLGNLHSNSGSKD